MRVLIAAVLSICVRVPTCFADTALRRVILSTGGVGYFEYDADVDGAGTVALDVPIAQIDDLLKSLVVFDPSGGRRRLVWRTMLPWSGIVTSVSFTVRRPPLRSDIPKLVPRFRWKRRRTSPPGRRPFVVRAKRPTPKVVPVSIGL